MKQYTKYIKSAKQLGAKNAKVIRASSIKTAEWVRMKCQFGCDGYGHALTCPPNSPAPQQTKKMLGDYKYALLVHGGEWTDIRKAVAVLEREMFLDGFYKAFAMAAGPCNLCSRCPQHCAHPEKARPSMEACGIDVYRTAHNNGFPIKVAKTRNAKGNYYGVVLIE
ncbi:hypothetical protein COS16_11505 [Candidatus Desantisbacteria bacterium CG02_land_8_20_14_3_00_49_13]|nr:MAG: hypothetical protein COS16_11505 [Candidatus Desantisbacteria bacterium CG02_land_8_20_14_3_00_49_13]